MSKAPPMVIGAHVMFCGHNGYFVADIRYIGNVAVVTASAPVDPATLIRNRELGPATHVLVDFPASGYWSPRKGIFVVPADQVSAA